MRVETGKAVFRCLRAFIFLFLLLKGTFSLKAAYAQSTNGCAVKPECLALLKSEFSSTIAAPAAVATTATIISVTSATRANTPTTESVAGVAVLGDVRVSGVTNYYIWDQLQNEQAQNKAKQKHCTANPSDWICVPFTGGQSPGVLYRIWYSGYYVGQPKPPYTGIPPANLFPNSRNYGPIYGPRTQWGEYRNQYGYWTKWRAHQVLSHGQTSPPVDYAPTSSPVVRQWGGASGGGPVEQYRDFRLAITAIVRDDGRPDNSGNPPPLDWKDWPQEKRDAAVGLLDNSDWRELRDSMPEGGIVGPGDRINTPGGIIIPGQDTDDPNTPQDERQPQKIPGPYTFPENTTAPEWPDYLNIPGLNDREKFRLKERVDKGKLTEQDVERIRPRPIPNDPNNRRCLEIPMVGHLGDTDDFPDHGQYATQVTGSPNDLFVMGENGYPYAYYDGEVNGNGITAMLEDDGAVAEVKTQHAWLLRFAERFPSTELLTQRERDAWDNRIKIQLTYQAKTAEACNLQYFIAFERQDVVTQFGPKLVDMLKKHYSRIRVHHLPFYRP